MQKLSGSVLVAAVLSSLMCARSPESPTRASDIRGTAGDDGRVGTSAVGDVKTGPGALEIEAVRMDRQNARSGASIVRQYADPGRVYGMGVGEQIELWVEWDRNSNKVPSVVPNNPRLTVDWGAGEIDRTDSHICGSCKMFHIYPRPGLYTVVVTLDDRAGTVVTRTFFLDSRLPAPTPTPTATPTPSPTPFVD